MSADINPTAAELIAFLNGSGEIDGLAFGDTDFTKRRPHFWWRKYLHVLEAAPESSASAQAVDANGRLDNFMRGVIAALGVMANHGFRHGTVYHDEIVRSVGEADLYAVAEAEDYEWAGLNKRKKPRKQSKQSPVQASDAGRQG